jgi:hypothetical protein
VAGSRPSAWARSWAGLDDAALQQLLRTRVGRQLNPGAYSEHRRDRRPQLVAHARAAPVLATNRKSILCDVSRMAQLSYSLPMAGWRS